MNHQTVEQLRQIVNSDNWPIDINDWPVEVNRDTNCLAYALGLPFPDKKREIFNGSDCSIRLELLGFFRELGLEWREISSAKVAKDDEIVIQAYEYRKIPWGSDFHVVRRDYNGKWSHKEGWECAPNIIADWGELVFYIHPDNISCIFAVKKSTS